MERPGYAMAAAIPIDRRQQVGNDKLAVGDDISDTVSSFDRFEQCAASVRSGPVRLRLNSTVAQLASVLVAAMRYVRSAMAWPIRVLPRPGRPPCVPQAVPSPRALR